MIARMLPSARLALAGILEAFEPALCTAIA
jgi:hypothetical protein